MNTDQAEQQRYIQRVISKIDALIGPLNSDKPSAVYVLDQVDRLGQFAAEMLTLRSLFPLAHFDVIVFISTLRVRSFRVNVAVYKAFTAGIKVVKIDEDTCAWLAQQTLGLVESNNRQYLLLHACMMCHLTMTEVLGKGITATMTLSDEDAHKGRCIKQTLGVDSQAPMVSVHVRDAGCVPAVQHSYRDASLANYLPLIQQLLAEGYVVARIGDNTMTPLSLQHRNLIDAPFHAQYDPFMDLYFAAASKIFVGTFSGPQAIAIAYNTPCLVANCPITSLSIRSDLDLLLPKIYYSSRIERSLSYEEIVTSDLPECFETDKFTRKDITLVQNTPDQIIAGFDELNARLNGTYEIDPKLALRIAEINQIGHLIRQQGIIHGDPASPVQAPNDFYAAALSKSDLSHEYIKMCPGFVHY